MASSSPVIRRLAELLAREREAAIVADIDLLEVLQDEKRELLDLAYAEETDEPALHHLAEMARANVVLIRQLVTLHRALAGIDAVPGYGADGRERTSPHGAVITRRVL